MPATNEKAKDHDRYWRARALGVCVQHGCHRAAADDRIYCDPCAQRKAEARVVVKKGDKGLKNYQFKKRNGHTEAPKKTPFDIKFHEGGVEKGSIGKFETGSDALAAIRAHAEANGIVLTGKTAPKTYEVLRDKRPVSPSDWMPGLFR